MEKENIKSYDQTCQIIRHYSTISFNIRAAVIVHGMVFLSLWCSTYSSENECLPLLLSVFGILLTAILFCFYCSYYVATNSFYQTVAEMEDILFDDKFKPFKRYNGIHKQRYGSRLNRLFGLYAPFALVGILFFICLILSLIRMHC